MRRLDRRQFLLGGMALAGVGLAAGCGTVRLPWISPPRLHTIGNLGGGPPNATTDGFVATFKQAMRDLGYVEGETFRFEIRRANNDDQYDVPIAELISLQPTAILVPAAAEGRAVQAKTTSIPIVSAGVGDLVKGGLAASAARPGGNVTGLSTPLLADKHLEHLKAAIPSLARVAVLVDERRPEDFDPQAHLEAARQLNLDLRVLKADGVSGLKPFFESAVREQCQAVYLTPIPLVTSNQDRIAQLALQYRLPAIAQQSDAARRGQLLCYGPNREDLYRRSATFVDKIIKGAKPGEIPIEQPTLFDFGINLKTAEALGLTIPQNVIAQATEVIQ
jgi:putative tryptophan/tyrosine transport system substrate-binding protein